VREMPKPALVLILAAAALAAAAAAAKKKVSGECSPGSYWHDRGSYDCAPTDKSCDGPKPADTCCCPCAAASFSTPRPQCCRQLNHRDERDNHYQLRLFSQLRRRALLESA